MFEGVNSLIEIRTVDSGGHR